MSTEQQRLSTDEKLALGIHDDPPPATDKPFRKVVDVLDIEKRPYFTNFDGDRNAIYRLLALAKGNTCLPGEQVPEGGIDLKYWYFHRVEMVAKVGGEIIEPIRSVLIDKGGKAYQFVSNAIPNEVDTLRECFGDGPYTDAMKIKVTKFKTGKGMQTYTIAPV